MLKYIEFKCELIKTEKINIEIVELNYNVHKFRNMYFQKFKLS